MDEDNVMYTSTHTHNGIDSAMRKEILPFATPWMNPQCNILRERSQAEKDKYHVISLTYVWTLKEPNSKTESRRLVSRG